MKRAAGACGAAVVLLAAAAACNHGAGRKLDAAAPRPNDTKGRLAMEPKIDRNCDFSQVESLTEEYPCTPKLGPRDEDVIRINAPEEVRYSSEGDGPLDERHAKFVICGAMKMRTETLYDLGIVGPEHLDAIMLVAVDAKTGKTYTGPIPQLGMREPMPEELRKKVTRTVGYVIGSCFNPNLVRSFELPAVDADYFVHAVLGPFKSNVLRVRLRRG
jgi:hypothetical protein